METAAYSTTMALSTLRKLLARKDFRRGGGIEFRRRERLFGASGPGRSKRLSSGVKLEKLGDAYDPRADKCLNRRSCGWWRRPPPQMQNDLMP